MPQRKLTKRTEDEGMILEKYFWEMSFGSEDVLPVYKYLETYFLMIVNMKGYVQDNDDSENAYKDDFGFYYRDNIIAQVKQDLYYKNFSLQVQCNCDELDTFQKRITFCFNVVDMEDPIPDYVYDYEYGNSEMDFYFRWSRCDSELRELKNFLINDSEIN